MEVDFQGFWEFYLTESHFFGPDTGDAFARRGANDVFFHGESKATCIPNR